MQGDEGDRDSEQSSEASAAYDSVIEGLRASSLEAAFRYSCCGSFKQAVAVAYERKDGSYAPCGLQLPAGDQQQQVEDLLEACSEASFGRGAQDVFDPSYRSAKMLPESRFVTDLCVTRVLDSIAALVGTAASSLTASLDKLNVYSEGNFFKVHLDTPRSEHMLGSLVVCLPCAHSGGALIVKHQGQQTTYDWGAQLQEKPDSVFWGFHYLDVEHEITPVTSGHRLTLTYGICNVPDAKLTGGTVQLAACLPFGIALRAALDTPFWQPDGIQLGFALSHLYPRHTRIGFNPALLKGADAAMLAAAHQLKLDAEIVPVWSPGSEHCRVWDETTPAQCGCEACCKKAGPPGIISSRLAIGGDFPTIEVLEDSFGGEDEFEDDLATRLGHYPKDACSPRSLDVHWVTSDFETQDALLAYGWGNEGYTDCIMTAAALIINVPPASERTY